MRNEKWRLHIRSSTCFDAPDPTFHYAACGDFNHFRFGSHTFSRYLSGSRLDYSSGGWKCVNVRFGRSLPVPRAGCRFRYSRVRPTNRRFHNSLWCVSGCKVKGEEGAKNC